MYQRKYLKQLSIRLTKEPRKFIQVLYGPRQIGKTTLANQLAKQSPIYTHYVSADGIIEDPYLWIEQQWQFLRIKMKGDKLKKSILIIDEVQKISNWSEQVKREWDEDSKNEVDIKVLLLGSSRLLIQKGLTESLAGRFETTYACHWSYEEMNEAFGIDHDQFVWFGGYPGSVSLMKDETRWKRYILDSIIEATISRDLLMFTRVDKPVLMRRMFEFGCQYSGQILSYTKMLGQLHDAGNTTTLSHYLHLLDSTGLLTGLEKYSPNLIRKRSSSPKFQVHNNALMTAIQSNFFKTIRKEPIKWGRWVESSLGTHLLNYCIKNTALLYYWRNGNDEIDFVLEKNGYVIGIEVKSGLARGSTGMKSFKKIFKPEKIYMIGKDGFSWQDFLSMEPSQLF